MNGVIMITKNWTSEQHATIVAEYRKGTSYRGIAKILGVDFTLLAGVVQRLRQAGVDLPKRRGRSTIDVDSLNKL